MPSRWPRFLTTMGQTDGMDGLCFLGLGLRIAIIVCSQNVTALSCRIWPRRTRHMIILLLFTTPVFAVWSIRSRQLSFRGPVSTSMHGQCFETAGLAGCSAGWLTSKDSLAWTPLACLSYATPTRLCGTWQDTRHTSSACFGCGEQIQACLRPRRQLLQRAATSCKC